MSTACSYCGESMLDSELDYVVYSLKTKEIIKVACPQCMYNFDVMNKHFNSTEVNRIIEHPIAYSRYADDDIPF